MDTDKEIIPINWVSVVCYRLSPESFFPEILLIKKSNSNTYELPGGRVEYHLDAKQGSIFKDCAVRKCLEESGVILRSEELILDGQLQQRVLYEDKWLIGIVHLYRTDLHDANFSFTNNESYRSLFRVVSKDLLQDLTTHIVQVDV